MVLNDETVVVLSDGDGIASAVVVKGDKDERDVVSITFSIVKSIRCDVVEAALPELVVE